MSTIRITKRAADEYIAKFDPQLASIVNVSERIKAVAKDLIPVFKKARYISKNEKGKLYRSYDLRIDMVVIDDAMVTLFPLRHALKSEKRLNHSKHPFEMERN
jgi:hypothetical protein